MQRSRALAVLPQWRTALRYGAGVAGVAAVTWLISLVLPHYRVANISMLYLLLVLALAVYAGSGPAILASLLAFFAFDWFFVPPVGRFTVDDPEEWLALFLFLVVAVITGQLAAGLRREAEEARRRARETTTLYELSTAILGDARLDRVLQAIAERLLTTLDFEHVAVLLLGSNGRLDVAAEAGAALDAARREERAVNAHWALAAGVPTTRHARAGTATLTRPVSATGKDRQAPDGSLATVYLPIGLGGQALGVVAAFFKPRSRPFDEDARRLLDAFAAQAALAVGRSRLAEEEERARAAAESERLKSAFLASVSHDLRTPLTAIKTAAEALRQDAESRSDAAHRDLSVSIVLEADRLNHLVGNLLELSRIEAGGLPLHVAPEDLSELVGGVVQRLAPLLAGRPLSVQIADDLPLIDVDAVQIDRVLANLLENAAKFSPPGRAIALEATAAPSARQVVLRVRNAGRTLTEAERARIFDRFYSPEANAERSRGTGLGLAICKGIVEAHGGRIWAEDDADGVTIALSLPVARAAGHALTLGPSPNPEPADGAEVRQPA